MCIFDWHVKSAAFAIFVFLPVPWAIMKKNSKN